MASRETIGKGGLDVRPLTTILKKSFRATTMPLAERRDRVGRVREAQPEKPPTSPRSKASRATWRFPPSGKSGSRRLGGVCRLGR